MKADSTLIQQIKEGRKDYRLLVKKYERYVFSVCFAMLKSRELAEEAAQDTFIKAYKALANYEQKAKFTTWLYRIAYRTSLDYIRKRKNNIDIDQVSFQLKDATDISKNIEQEEKNKMLSEAIHKLDPEEATILRMFYFEEMKIKEIAKITELKESNVKIKLFRSRTRLKKILEKEFKEF
jgi:RNA polymerase sigma-70 factor (ECF subfamily)